ncbi:hypothetical protein ABHI18_001812 [Aspergillus niger]
MLARLKLQVRIFQVIQTKDSLINHWLQPINLNRHIHLLPQLATSHQNSPSSRKTRTMRPFTTTTTITRLRPRPCPDGSNPPINSHSLVRLSYRTRASNLDNKPAPRSRFNTFFTVIPHLA